ncbi:MAG TPA: threonine--tRNA ligase [Polyangiaceae bacterium]|nr:threonine--tRNA ligase [Polyangiaceae bacterium]
MEAMDPQSAAKIAGSDERLSRIRHSLAHVLAQAVQEIRPGARLGFGPPIEDGFYFDFVLPAPITLDDFPELESRMRCILATGQAFEREALPGEDALARLAAASEPYKSEYASELLSRRGLQTLSFYRSGAFVDLCEGPHVASTLEIPADGFKLLRVAGAYWRGDARNVMMTRIYAWAFLTAEELAARALAHAAALARDHKKLGKELELFTFDDDIGKGLPLWLPNGTAIRDELEKLMKELEFQAGFQRIATPPLAKQNLYYRTGHLPYYAAHMFPFMRAEPAACEPSERTPEAEEAQGTEPEVYCLRPMNCPHHHKVFAAQRRSYRDLPLRFAEYGQTFRYEDSGAVSGLLRVRAMNMNDGHIYCTEAQIVPECLAVLEMHRRAYDVLGLRDWRVRLSLRDTGPGSSQKFVDDDAGWRKSEDLLRQVLEKSGFDYHEGAGEAAFYGPKIDFQFRSVTGREETASTLQLDFSMAERLDLHYTGPDGAEHRPFILHRAPLGTHERFVALLIEHYGGVFPTWLAPVQVAIIPVAAEFEDCARRLCDELRARLVRAKVDGSSESLNKKMRAAQLRKVPNLVVLGERERQADTVSLRRYGSREQLSLPRAEFIARIAQDIAERAR